MKLCLVISSLSSGGAERVATTLANYWVQSGWQVTVITLADRGGDFYALAPSVKRVTLSCVGESAGSLSGLRNNLARVRALRRTLTREKPDVALGFMPSINILCALASVGTGITVIGTEHVHPPTLDLGQPWAWLRRRVYPHLAAVSALTETSAEWIREHTGAKYVPVMPNPITYPVPAVEPTLNPSAEKERLGGDYVLLAAGRLADQKGFDRLLDAFAAVHRRQPDWRLIILGEGPLRVVLERQCHELGLSDFVSIPGAVGNIGAWYEAADAFVLTSRYEGFGNVLAEALAYGVPAVAVDCNTGPRDILRNEVDGLLVPQNDQEALAAALDRLMGDKALRARFAERAVEARERFAIERIAAQWEEVFARV